MTRLADLWRAVFGPDPEPHDGYGQSLIDDIRSARRFRALRRQSIAWQLPTQWPGDLDHDFPIIDRFGDGALCWHSDGDETRVIIDRMWHGWPDPPEFAIFAFDAERQIKWATDFATWPQAWARAQKEPTAPAPR